MAPTRPHPLRRTLIPVLCVDGPSDCGTVALARFDFAAVSARPGGLPLLAGPLGAERWQSMEHNAFRIETLAVDLQQGIAAAAEHAYRQLLARVRGSAQPYLLRIWNFFPQINQGEGDDECYRHFCVGRARAVDAMFSDPPPAATAIGLVDPADARLQITALCGAEPGIALENPRQTPAWRYPREYGPVPPGFSRGAVLGQGSDAVLLASGTASIVGHVSLHAGDVAAQCRESFANLQALLDEGNQRSRSAFALQGCMALRVYLRHAEDVPRVREQVLAMLGDGVPVRYLHGDICRRDLDVEIEGVFAAQ